MSDEIEVVEEPELKQPEPQDKKASFSQDDVNRLIAKEKASWKRSADRGVAEHETIVEGLNASLTARDAIITKQIELLRPDTKYANNDEWKLLSDGRDVVWQFNLVLGEIEKADKEEIPPTPPAFKDGSKTPAFTRTTVI